MDMAKQTMVAVMFPCVTMYVRVTEVEWMAASMAESFGLNVSPMGSPPLLFVFPEFEAGFGQVFAYFFWSYVAGLGVGADFG